MEGSVAATRSSPDASSLRVAPHRGTGAEWDDIVRAQSEASFCHLSAWRSIIEDLYDHECLYVSAVDEGGDVRGVLPLVRIRGPLVDHHLVSVPLLNYGGPVGDPAAADALAGWAVRHGRLSGADVVELRTRHRAPEDVPISRRKVAVVLDLPDSADTLFHDVFRSKLRSQIRRPRKEGMEARFGPDQLGAFYEVFAHNMRDLGTPVHPRGLFERIRDAFGDAVAFGAVYWDDRPVAGGCGFVWRDEFEMTWASSLRECRRQAPNMLLYWSFMERMIDRGVGRFNFGRSTPGGGTHRFKRQWGGDDEELPWVRWTREDTSSTTPEERPLVRFARDVWRRVPLPVANRAGPVLAKRLPWW